VNFSRPAVDECTLQCSQCEVQAQPWPQPVLPHTTNITTRIGPSGGERGYAGITGKAKFHRKFVVKIGMHAHNMGKREQGSKAAEFARSMVIKEAE